MKYNVHLDEENQKLLDEIVDGTTPEAIKKMDERWIKNINSMTFFKRKEYFKKTHDPRINLKNDEYPNINYYYYNKYYNEHKKKKED